MSVLDNYECDGQISLNQFMDKQKELEQRYPIPRLKQEYLSREGWTDDWHYADVETPDESDVYYSIQLWGDQYFYTYSAFANKKWFWWDSWGKTWKPMDKSHRILLAWVQIPSLYRQQDSALHEMLGLKGVI